MTPSDRALQEAFRRLRALRSGGDRDGCPSPEAILSLVERTGGERNRLQVLDHVMSCQACQGDFELLRSVSGILPRAPGAPRLLAGLTAGKFAVAASLVLLLGGGALWWRAMGPAPDSAMRGGDLQLSLVSPDAGQGLEDGTTFSWHPIPGGFEYTLEIFDEGGELLLARTTRDTTVILESRLPDGGREMRWWVTARMADGTLARSEVRRLSPSGY